MRSFGLQQQEEEEQDVEEKRKYRRVLIQRNWSTAEGSPSGKASMLLSCWKETRSLKMKRINTGKNLKGEEEHGSPGGGVEKLGQGGK